MWGRESINTPIKVKGPKPDPLLNPQGPDLANGFGDALTAALDVMAFTHDLEINAQGLNLTNNAVKAANPQNQKPLTMNPDLNKTCLRFGSTDGTMLGTLTQLTSAQVAVKDIGPSIPVPVGDPLRDLVLESLDQENNPERLNSLALQAANLPQTEEIVLGSDSKAVPSVKNLAGIFTGTDNFVKKMEDKVKKKFSVLECSDSEGFGDVILGKISRIKRAKSAHLRNSANKKRALDKKKLIVSSDSSSTEISPTEETTAAPIPKNLDYAEERMKSVKEELKTNPDSRPINIDVAMKQDDQNLSTTLSEDILKVSGGNVKVKKRKKRSKTAKSNRVAPTVSDTRHCKSEASINPENLEPCSSPDPLEPWSTKSITNMNAILAWEQDNSI